MKTKSMIVIVCIILAAAFMLGATGVISVAGKAAEEAENRGADRLIGVFITKDHLDLFDFDQFLSNNVNKLMSAGEISEVDSSEYSGRLYAKLIETTEISETGESMTSKEYVFDFSRPT